MSGEPRWAAPAAVLFSIVYLLAFAGDGLVAFFSGDDLMNLHGYWMTPWSELLGANLLFFSDSYRPLGGLYYRALYAAFGFEPLPFRVACFLLLGLNLGLLFAVARRLTRGALAAALTALLFAYNARMPGMYYSGGTVYDSLCLFFYLAAFLLYIHARQQNRVPGRGRLAAILVLFVCALNAKEMAVTFPLVLLIYEIAFHARPMPRRAAAWAIVLSGGMAALYVWGKMGAGNRMLGNAAYALDVSLSSYLGASARYAEELFYLDGLLDPVRIAVLWAAMAALAWLARSKTLFFALGFIVAGVAPIAFIPYRGDAYAYYIPSAGWALYLGALVAVAARRLPVPREREARSVAAAALVGAVALALAPLHLRERGPRRRAVMDGVSRIGTMVGRLEKELPPLDAGDSVLLLDDPFEDWSPLFAVRLLAAERELVVLRRQRQKGQALLAEPSYYDHVVEFEGERLRVRGNPTVRLPAEPVEVRFEPARVRPGDSYSIHVPEMAGRQVDVAFRGGAGFFAEVGVAEAFCTFDERGRARIETPREQPPGRVEITHIRAAKERWRRARGAITVVAADGTR